MNKKHKQKYKYKLKKILDNNFQKNNYLQILHFINN